MRTILDCERDAKERHKWETIGATLLTYILWCRACGAIGSRNEENEVRVFYRVQEKDDGP